MVRMIEIRKGQSSIESPAATAQVACGDNCATRVAHRLLHGQSSIEFMLLLVAVAVVSLLALSTVNSQMSVQKEVHANASNLLEKSSLALAGNLSAATSNPYAPNNGSSGDETDIHLELATSQPYYTNQTSVVQLVAWNYGGRAVTIPKLLLQSNSSDVGFTPNETVSALVGLSYTMTSSITPRRAGTYLLSGKALDSAGIVMRNSDGQPVRVNGTVIVLSAPGGGGGDGPITALNYTLSLLATNPKIIYGTQSSSEAVIKISSWTEGCGSSGGTCGCSGCSGANSMFCTTEYESGTSGCSGCPYTVKHCFREEKAYSLSRINTLPQYDYDIQLNITNATNVTASGTMTPYILNGTLLTQTNLSAQLSGGNGALQALGSASGTGPSPTGDTILIAPISGGAWTMRDYGKYMDYNAQLPATRSVLAACSGQIGLGSACSVEGAHNAVSVLNSKADALLSSQSASARSCSVSGDYVFCTPASFTYPTIMVDANSTFLGGHIPRSNPQIWVISGVTAQVSSD